MKSSPCLRRDLKYSHSDSFFFSVMVGAGETFLPAFVLALGLGQVAAGLVAAVPFLVAAFVQLAAPWAIARVGSYRRWLTGLALLQAISFLPLAWAAWTEAVPAPIVFGVVTLYWACGLSSGPAWNTWMSSVIPLSVRTQYFAFRGHLGQIGLLLGLVGAGFGLQYFKDNGHELIAFAVLFLVSGVFRLASAYCLSRQSERPHLTRSQKPVPWKELIARMRRGRDGRLILFLVIFQVAVYISSPFFNPFMLQQLQLPYTEYMALVAVSFATKILIFPHLGEFGKRVGPFKLMQASIFGTACLPLLWMVSHDYTWLLVTQIFSGAAWAVFELGMTLALFESIRDEERTGFLSLYNFVNALAIVGGTLIGAKLLLIFGEGQSGYMLIFALSAFARMGCIVLLERAVLQPGERRNSRETIAWLASLPKEAVRISRIPARTIASLPRRKVAAKKAAEQKRRSAAG